MQVTQPRTILIADDHDMVRQGIGLLLQTAFGSASLVHASDANSLDAALSAQPRPDVALVDLHMPGMVNGDRLREIAHRHQQVPLVVVTAMTSADVIRKAYDTEGVYAVVPKSAGTERLQLAVQYALRREKLPFMWDLSSADAYAQNLDGLLTPRQAEVHSLLRQGMSNKAIAQQLGLADGTVRNYLNEIYAILKVNNRTQAVVQFSDSDYGKL